VTYRNVCALLALCAVCAAETVGDGLIRLENARVVVELSPRLGGRITTLRRPNGPNLLAVLPELLRTRIDALPRPAPDGGFLPGNGHVVWIGPQRGWWANQDLNPARRDARATWPPDPWLAYGDMQVVEQGDDHVVLLGPTSPITGLRLRLALRMEADGSVVQAIEATNASPHTVSWDIWPNTRVRGEATVYAPYEAKTRLRIEHATYDPQAEMALPAALHDGYLSFDTNLPVERAGLLNTGKAFLTSTRPRLFAALGQDLLIVAAAATDPTQVHSDHTPVEIFQCIGGAPIRTVLELEFHSAYRTLEPGAAMRFAVAWRIVPLDFPGTAAVRQHEADAVRLGESADAAFR
jgi:hypothetical protein